MPQTLRSIWRLITIARTLRRHDALAFLRGADLKPGLLSVVRLFASGASDGRPGEKLTRALTELGPSFIKLGQVLSTRADLIGEPMAEDLSALQDRLPPFSAREARETIDVELGRPLPEVFQEFEDTPLSAASIRRTSR